MRKVVKKAHDPEEVLDVQGAALVLKVPVSTVYTLAQKGRIPGRKVGKHWRFRRDTLMAWLLMPSWKESEE
jgi:excisionase family DNA binding protein